MRLLAMILTAVAVATLLAPASSNAQVADRPLPPANVHLDYQLGGAYQPAQRVGVVSRDWFRGDPLPGGYSICYVNAFQTQGNYLGVRPDEERNWPRRLVLRSFGQDPNWPGEYPIDIRSRSKRVEAARWVRQMVQTCADKGFDAVEFDNVDTWVRFADIDTPRPLQRRHAVRYARLLTRHAHSLGLTVAQKNAWRLTPRQSLEIIGYDFVIAEGCGKWNECDRYTRVFGDRMLAVEYDRRGFRVACRQLGDRIAVVLRDQLLVPRGEDGYRFRTC